LRGGGVVGGGFCGCGTPGGVGGIGPQKKKKKKMGREPEGKLKPARNGSGQAKRKYKPEKTGARGGKKTKRGRLKRERWKEEKGWLYEKGR